MDKRLHHCAHKLSCYRILGSHSALVKIIFGVKQSKKSKFLYPKDEGNALSRNKGNYLLADKA